MLQPQQNHQQKAWATKSLSSLWTSSPAARGKQAGGGDTTPAHKGQDKRQEQPPPALHHGTNSAHETSHAFLLSCGIIQLPQAAHSMHAQHMHNGPPQQRSASQLPFTLAAASIGAAVAASLHCNSSSSSRGAEREQQGSPQHALADTLQGQHSSDGSKDEVCVCVCVGVCVCVCA